MAFLIIAIIVLMIFNNSRQINARINIGIGFVKNYFNQGRSLYKNLYSISMGIMSLSNLNGRSLHVSFTLK